MPLSGPVALPRARDVLRSRPDVVARAVDDAQATISELFCAHDLQPLSRDPIRMTLRSMHAADLGVELLDYGAAVRISPEGLGDFHLVQIPLAGSANMTVDRIEVHSDPRTATLPPLDSAFSMVWEAGTPQLIVYLRREALARAAGAVYGTGDHEAVTLAPQLRLDTAAGRVFLRAAFDYHDALEAGPASAYAERLAGELMMARLLAAVENSAAPPARAEGSVAASPAALVRRFLELLDGHACEELGVLDLAEALRVPLRTLQEAVRNDLGSTPSRLLLDARLRRAHELLQDGDPAVASVTEIAERCGFTHLGRFAGAYRALYGVSPSATLRA